MTRWLAVPLLLWPIGCARQSTDEQAIAKANPHIAELSAKTGFEGPPKRIYIRAFKLEEQLEVWGSEQSDGPMSLITTYRIARLSGKLGPKRKEGDFQVPEGLYVIDRFNPNSQFHLSLGLDYPNASDRVRSDAESPGSDIFIHGSDVSIGCLAMTDSIIEEIWAFAVHARDSGQRDIPVHIFPARLGEAGMSKLKGHSALPFWKELKPFYDAFENDHVVPRFKVAPDGSYQLLTD